YLLLWPTLTALVIAGGGRPSVANLIIFTLGVFFMRSAGCV
ncbi:MAG TPA: 4-hydroxybenzoate octaprenyltransferase, partial [Pseudomonas sp.]|nr:4-hydroxybenzoate octaprenyltransferase [Pseudomonas sp.]